MALTEYIAVAFGFAYILLAIRQHRGCWVAGGISSLFYIAVFIEAGLPLQAALQVVYVVMSVYGWIAWRAGSEHSRPPQSWPLSRHLIAVAGTALATAVSAALLLRHGLSDAPLAESLGTWASIVATWLLARRVIDTWYWWMVIDTGLAGLFASQGLYFTAALYFAYALLAIAGLRTWRRSLATAP